MEEVRKCVNGTMTSIFIRNCKQTSTDDLNLVRVITYLGCEVDTWRLTSNLCVNDSEDFMHIFFNEWNVTRYTRQQTQRPILSACTSIKFTRITFDFLSQLTWFQPADTFDELQPPNCQVCGAHVQRKLHWCARTLTMPQSRLPNSQTGKTSLAPSTKFETCLFLRLTTIDWRPFQGWLKSARSNFIDLFIDWLTPMQYF